MSEVEKLFLTIGCAGLALDIITGAYSRHISQTRFDDRDWHVWRTARRYQVIHCLGLVVVGLLSMEVNESALLRSAGWLMVAGVVLFAGSLYATVLTKRHWAGAFTPAGGLALIASWIVLIVAVWNGL